MKRSPARDQAVRTTQAIDRVLVAERDAEAALARQQAQATLALARQDALAELNHAQDRIAGWQSAHAARRAGRLAAPRAQA